MLNIKKFFGKHWPTILTSILIIVIIITATHFSIHLPTVKEFGWTWGNSIAFFVGMLGIAIAIFTGLQNNLQFKKGIKNSNDLLEKQLTRRNMQDNLFDLIKNIMDFYYNPLENGDGGIIDQDTIDNFVDKIEKTLPFHKETITKNYLHYKKIINSPEKFNYLSLELKDNIREFNKLYNKAILNRLEELKKEIKNLKIIYENSLPEAEIEKMIKANIEIGYIKKGGSIIDTIKMVKIFNKYIDIQITIPDEEYETIENALLVVYKTAAKENLKYSYE